MTSFSDLPPQVLHHLGDGLRHPVRPPHHHRGLAADEEAEEDGAAARRAAILRIRLADSSPPVEAGPRRPLRRPRRILARQLRL
ncbi:MAG: hypothetical protein ACK55Z_35070 [bacterium]